MDKKDIYFQLPYPLKVATATIWGKYLRWWRYGSKTEDLIQEILERDNWSDLQWQIYHENRLGYILERAATRVPYYRNYWSSRRIHGDHSSWEYLENWPILPKEAIRKDPKQFVSDDCNIRKMYVDHTGGTTGTPLTIFESRDTVQSWYAMYEARVRRWHNVSYKDRWAILGGQMIVPLDQAKPPYWVENAGLDQLYLSTYHIKKETIEHYAKKISEYQPTHMVVYPSSAVEFSLEIVAQGIDIWHPKVIFANAEPLSQGQRSIIENAFHCKVINTYGMGEIVFGASECRDLSMHTWPDSGIMEVLDEIGKSVGLNETGLLNFTGLVNPDMILIRYAIGDRGKQARLSDCACGRSLPIMYEIEGRSSDLLITSDGRKIFWVNPVFYGLHVSQAQIIQEAIDQVRVKVIPAEKFGHRDIEKITDRLHERIGKEARVFIDIVETIAREKNGKLRPVISMINH